MKIFYILAILTAVNTHALADDMQLGGRIASRAVSTSPRAYAQDHFKRRAGIPHRYQNWRYNYGNRPDRFHTSYGWQEHRPMTYPYMQHYYSSPHVVVRQPIIMQETIHVQTGHPYAEPVLRDRDGYHGTHNDYQADDYAPSQYDRQLPWQDNGSVVQDNSGEVTGFDPEQFEQDYQQQFDDGMVETSDAVPQQPYYVERHIVRSPEEERLRHRSLSDPLEGLWNAIGLGYE
jgi:hypothetical protein